MIIRALWLVARSLGLALDYERSRAKNPREALKHFLAWLPSEFSRLRQVGLSDYLRLLRLELNCAEAGLGFTQGAMAMGPPWLLPSHFVKLPVAEMPDHSLIDPQYLLKIAASVSGSYCDTVDTLAQLLAGDLDVVRWKGLNRINAAAEGVSSTAEIAVCLHLFYPEMWPELDLAMNSIPEPFDLYITLPSFTCSQALQRIAESRPGTRFFFGENRGRDVLPFIKLMRLGYFDHYTAVCKLHSKRSPHMRHGERWRKELISSILGCKGNVKGILDRFCANPRLGIIGPETACIHPGANGYQGTNYGWLRELKARASLTESAAERPFFAGTMFWFRPQALAQLKALPICEQEFPLEMSQTDGTPAHAIERLIWPLVEAQGFFAETHSTCGEA